MQQKMKQHLPDPREEYEQALAALALQEALAREGTEPPVDELPAEEQEELTLSAQHLRDRFPELVRRAKRPSLSSFQESLHDALPTIKTAALILLIGNLMLTLAIAASGGLRATFRKLLITETDEYFEIRYQTVEQAVEVPKEWTGPFYPAFIPEGYEIQRVYCEPTLAFIEAYNSHGQHFFFYVSPIDSASRYDNDGYPYDIIAVNNYAGYVFTTDYETMLLWCQDGCEISIHSDCTYDELLQAAESVIPVQ